MWSYPEAGLSAALGSLNQHGDGRDLAIVTYGNGTYLSRRAQADLEADGYAVRIIDLRWLAPLAEDALLTACEGCRAVLIVDECRKTGSQSEALMTLFHERSGQPLARVTAEDSFIATGPAYAATLPSREGIATAARALLA